MTDPATVPEAAEAAEISHFLRRFADLMSNGQNAEYLTRAADLMDSLVTRVSSAVGEEQLWRYKYETLSQQTDELESECESLRHDVERHVKLSSFIINERDTLKATLEGRETELTELGNALKQEQEGLKREQETAAAKSQAHELAFAELRTEFEQERTALKASLEASIKQTEQQRGEFLRERDELAAKLSQSEAVMAEFRLAFDRERADWQSRLSSREDELSEIRVVAANEHEELRQTIETLEARRDELRSELDTVNQRGVATNEQVEAASPLPAVQSSDRDPAPGENRAVVLKETLRQARAQFEFLAKECIRRGDVATQAMCELGVHTMDQALTEDTKSASSVDEVALSILGPVAEGHPGRQMGAENY